MGVSRISCLNTRFHAGRKLNFLQERKRTSLTSALLPLRRNPPRIGGRRDDRFLRADFPVLISSMSGLAIYHSSRRSWQANWQRSLAQRAGNTSRTGSNGNPHPRPLMPGPPPWGSRSCAGCGGTLIVRLMSNCSRKPIC